jgi:hypothetical protein
MEGEVLDGVDQFSRPGLVERVDAYARRIYPAVLDQHDGGSVSSPLGVWLLLAACVRAAAGEYRLELERALSCSAEQAGELLDAFMAAPPPALKAAIAVWARVDDATEALASWVRGLPSAVESGFMPTQRDANEWADRNTDGLIKTFPTSIDGSVRVVLASALATKVSWEEPFDVVPASDHLAEGSPWRGRVERLLWDEHPRLRATLARTRAAGIVAVHQALAKEDLTVISVSAEPTVPRGAVLEAAHEVVASVRREAALPACSLFELPVGTGHSWEIAEHEIGTWIAGERAERIAGVSLPAWRAESRHDLRRSALFAANPALEVMRELIGPRPDDMKEAVQAAVASFTRFGFEAAAITVFAIALSAHVTPFTGIERTATLRFDHPYAAIAVAGRPDYAGRERVDSTYAGLPLFTAWVHEPEEVDPSSAAEGQIALR